MAKKNLEELLDEIFHENHSEENDIFLEIASMMREASKLEKEYQKDKKNPKLEVTVYADRANVQYKCKNFEHKAIAAKTAISAILASIEDKELREQTVLFACKETDTFSDL
jgi:hypothetical protein